MTGALLVLELKYNVAGSKKPINTLEVGSNWLSCERGKQNRFWNIYGKTGTNPGRLPARMLGISGVCLIAVNK